MTPSAENCGRRASVKWLRYGPFSQDGKSVTAVAQRAGYAKFMTMARKKNRRRGRHRGASAKANADLTTHIESLGLGSVTNYQSWCRSHGFTGALNKGWMERRKERAVAERELEARASSVGLKLHIESLGLEDEKAYQTWCKQNGLSEALNKGKTQRKKELALADRLEGEAVLARTRQNTRRLPDAIRAIYSGSLDPLKLRQPALEKIAAVFDRLGEEDTRQAYLKILLHVERHADLFGTKPAVSVLGTQDGNTFIEAMGLLAIRYRQRHRDVENWRPDTHNSRRQFGSLVRHLMCKYEVPTFMDTVWFYGTDKGAGRATGLVHPYRYGW